MKPEPLHEKKQSPGVDERQTRLDEIGRALNHYKRAADPLLRLAPIKGTPDRGSMHPCPRCGHQRWTETGCAACALFGWDQ